MTCNDRQDLIIAHLLGTLEAPEARALCDHLARGCPTCAGFAAEMTEVLGRLPLAQAHLAMPPAALRQELLVRVAPPPLPPPPPQAPPPPASSPSGTASTLEAAVAVFNRPLSFLQALAVTGVIVVVGGLGASVALVDQRGKSAVRAVQASCAIHEAHIAELASRVDVLTVRLLATRDAPSSGFADRDLLIDELESELIPVASTLAELVPPADMGRPVQTVLRDHGLRPVPGPPATPTPDWTIQEARIVHDAGRNAWYLFASHLPVLSGDNVYHLWFLKSDGTAASAGTFRVGPEGRGFLTGQAPADLDEYRYVAITDGLADPAASAQRPAGRVHLAGEL